MTTDGLDDVSQLGITTTHTDYAVSCELCGDSMDSERGFTHEKCRQAQERLEIIDAHQSAFNKLPADVILTLNIMVASYYEGLADKKEVGENISFWIYTVQEGMKEKHKEMHS